jgi:NAD(P) transhydrogenase subunit alpha
MVDSMKPGSVIVDMAAATGGNCEYTVSGEMTITGSGVKIIGYTDLPGRLPTQSSEMYATNLVNLAKLLSKEKDGKIHIDFDDVILRNMSVIRNGEVTFPPPAISVTAAPAKKETAGKAVEGKGKKDRKGLKWIFGLAGVVLFALLGIYSPREFLSHFTVFVLACVVGYYVVWNVTHSLHTPLMSVTNAISGIIVVGALLQIGAELNAVTVLSFIGILIATINVVGGFTVTQRMLKMFSKG